MGAFCGLVVSGCRSCICLRGLCEIHENFLLLYGNKLCLCQRNSQGNFFRDSWSAHVELCTWMMETGIWWMPHGMMWEPRHLHGICWWGGLQRDNILPLVRSVWSIPVFLLPQQKRWGLCLFCRFWQKRVMQIIRGKMSPQLHLRLQ